MQTSPKKNFFTDRDCGIHSSSTGLTEDNKETIRFKSYKKLNDFVMYGDWHSAAPDGGTNVPSGWK